MMKTRFILPALLLLILCCCTEKEGLPSADRLTVETVSTRVQLDGSGRTVWTEGDKFSVFYNSDSNERWKYTGKTGAASGQIEYSGPRTETGGGIIALYPYHLKASRTGTMVSTETQSVQQRAEGGFAPGAALMWARGGENGVLRFSYLCAFVRLDIIGNAEISELRFSGLSGEKVAGPVQIDFSGDVPRMEISGASASESIVMNGGGKGFIVEREGSFWFCIPAIHYKKGYCITVSYADGRTARASYGPGVTPEPGSVRVLTLNAAVRRVITLDFSKDTFPLTPSSGFTVPSGPTSRTWQGEEGQAVSKDGRVTPEEGDRFTFTSDGQTYELTVGASVHQWLANHGYYQAGYYWKPSSFFRFQTVGCWMKLPVVSGSRLVSIELSIVNSGAKSFSLVRTPSRQESAEEYAFSPDAPTTVWLRDSDSDEAWYLYGNNSYNAQISKMVLTYEKL